MNQKLMTKKDAIVIGSIFTLIPSLFVAWAYVGHKENMKNREEKLEGVVLQESENFSTHPSSPFTIVNMLHPLDHPPEEKHDNRNYLMWNVPDNRWVLLYTKDNSDPFSVLEQTKVVAYRTSYQAQVDIFSYVFQEDSKNEVDAKNLFVNVPVYELKEINKQ